MIKKAALFLVTIALSFSPCVSFRDVSSPALGFVSQAESGLLYKTLKGAAASVLIIRIAQKGLTVLAKKKIAGIIAKFGHEGEFRSTLIAGLEKFRGKVKNIDEIIDFVRSKFPTNKIDPPSALAEVPAIGGKAWSRVVNANGVRVYQKADLFEVTPQNLGLMRKGFAPYAKDGEPVVLHHMLQKEGEALAEVSSTMHNQLTKAIHINSGSQIPSGIDRFAFKAWKAEYWQSRAAGLEAVK